jgi:hypothetical protein
MAVAGNYREKRATFFIRVVKVKPESAAPAAAAI